MSIILYAIFNLTIYDQKTIRIVVKILFKNFTFQASWMSFFIFLYITWIISITKQQIQFYCDGDWWIDYETYGNFEKNVQMVLKWLLFLRYTPYVSDKIELCSGFWFNFISYKNLKENFINVHQISSQITKYFCIKRRSKI